MKKTEFMKKFILLEKSGKFSSPDEWEQFYDDYRIDEILNKGFLLDEFGNYLSTNNKQYSNIISFIQFLGDKENFKDSTIEKKLKDELVSLGDYTHTYIFYLETLFSINRDDSVFYVREFERLEKEGRLNVLLNKTFLRIFQNIKNNDLVMTCLKNLILDNTNFSAQFAIKK